MRTISMIATAVLLVALAWTDLLSAQSPSYSVSLEGVEIKRLLTVSVRVNDVKEQFALDTGTSHHILDLRLQSQLTGESHRIASSSMAATIYPPQRLSVSGEFDHHAKEVAVADLSSIRSASEMNIGGILGMPFFERRVVVLDLNNQRVVIASEEFPKSEVILPLIRDSQRVPFITDIEVADIPVLLCLDTGFTGTLTVKPKIFNILDTLGVLSNHCKARRQTYSEMTVDRAARVTKICLGKYQLTDVPIYETEVNAIGLELLRNFTTTIDLKQDELGLTANIDFNRYIAIHEINMSDGTADSTNGQGPSR